MKEKRKQLARLICELFNENRGNFVEVFKKACLLYRELYVEPVMKRLGVEVVPLEFACMDRGCIAYHDGTSVCLNTRFVEKAPKEERTEYALMGLISVAHEYRHHLQGVYAQSVEDGREIQIIREHIGSNAIEVANAYNNYIRDVGLYGDVESRNEARAMLALFPEIIKEIQPYTGEDELNKIIEVCNEAIYHQHLMEKDARGEEMRVFRRCLEDIRDVFPRKDIFSILEKYFQDCSKGEYALSKSYQVIAKKIDDVYSRLSVKDLAKLGFDLKSAQIKGFIAKQKGTENKYNKIFKDKMQVLKEAISILKDKYAGKRINRFQVEDELRRMFIQHGFYFAMDGENNALLDGKYFKILNEELITSDAFDKSNYLSKDEIGKLIVNYIERNQTKYVEKLLSRFDHATIRNVFSNAVESHQTNEGKAHFFGKTQIKTTKESKIVKALQAKFAELKQKNQDRTILFDDVDDFINMITALCDKLGVDYKSRVKMPEGDEFERETGLALLSLYGKAEVLAFDIATAMRGYQPNRAEFREDKSDYLLDEEYWLERVKRIYGELEYNRIINERRAMEEYFQDEGRGA